MKVTPRVLLMDDEVVFRRSFQRVLQREGLDVRIATSVLHLVKLANKDHYDAGIIDIRMTEGGSEGLEATQQLRKMQPEMYLEVITAYEEYESPALEMGADAVFIKPKGTKSPEAAQRIRRGILKKRLECLAKAAGMDSQELLDLQLLDSGSQSAWAAVRVSVVTDCIAQMDSFLESIAEAQGLDRQIMDALRQGLIRFFAKQAVEAKCSVEMKKESSP